jgi:hypothetical protein
MIYGMDATVVDLPPPQTRWFGSIYALVSVFSVSELCLCLSEFCYWQDALDSFVDFDENVDSFRRMMMQMEGACFASMIPCSTAP